MTDAFQFAVQYGYVVLFVWVFAEQIGLPVPSIPFLLTVGALAGAGRLNFAFALVLGLSAALLADLFWYYAGRRRGPKVLQFLCRLSFEPEACVRGTEKVFTKHGARSLLVAKFIPGLNLVAAPLAGLVRMHVLRFLVFDGLGALIWIGVYAGLGYLLSDQLERIAVYAMRLNTSLLFVLAGGILAFITWKYVRHRTLVRKSSASTTFSFGRRTFPWVRGLSPPPSPGPRVAPSPGSPQVFDQFGRG